MIDIRYGTASPGFMLAVRIDSGSKTIVMELIRALSISLVLSPKFGILVACVIRQFV